MRQKLRNEIQQLEGERDDEKAVHLKQMAVVESDVKKLRASENNLREELDLIEKVGA